MSPKPTLDRDAILATLTEYVAEEILEGDAEDLDEHTPLLELGVLNSLEIAKLLRFIRTELSLHVPHHEIHPENMVNLAAIASMVHRTGEEDSP